MCWTRLSAACTTRCACSVRRWQTLARCQGAGGRRWRWRTLCRAGPLGPPASARLPWRPLRPHCVASPPPSARMQVPLCPPVPSTSSHKLAATSFAISTFYVPCPGLAEVSIIVLPHACVTFSPLTQGHVGHPLGRQRGLAVKQTEVKNITFEAVALQYHHSFHLCLVCSQLLILFHCESCKMFLSVQGDDVTTGCWGTRPGLCRDRVTAQSSACTRQ